MPMTVRSAPRPRHFPTGTAGVPVVGVTNTSIWLKTELILRA